MPKSTGCHVTKKVQRLSFMSEILSYISDKVLTPETAYIILNNCFLTEPYHIVYTP